MRLPRDLSGAELARRLARYGYVQTRQTGSHARLTSTTGDTQHHVTIPLHGSLRVGTLSAVLREVASQLGRDRDELAEELFG